MVFERDGAVEAMRREAVFRGLVPAARGRILDRDGRILAWSERVFAVHWQVPVQAEQAARECAALASEPRLATRLPQPLPAAWPGTRVLLAQDLDADSAVRLEGLAGAVPGLAVTSHFRRQVVDDAAVQALVGRVARAEDGSEVGVSGIEREHDGILRGLPGAFQVMVDKQGRWLPETWQKIGELRPGYDVQLPLRARLAEGLSP
jgi:cell division protein FtsI/penicillin-binding protein 2